MGDRTDTLIDARLFRSWSLLRNDLLAQKRSVFRNPRVEEAILEAWRGIPLHFPETELDAFVVMPNHIHGVFLMVA